MSEGPLDGAMEVDDDDEQASEGEVDADARPGDCAADGGFELMPLGAAVAPEPALADCVAVSLAADPLEEQDQVPEAKRRVAVPPPLL